MSMEEKNKLLDEYINSLALEVNKKYSGLIDKDKIKELYDKFRDSDKDFKEDIVPDLNKLVEQIMDEFEKLKSDLESMMRLKYESELKSLNSLDMEVDKSSIFLREQQVNLMIISELSTKESLRSYIENACSEFPEINTNEILDNYDSIINEEQIEEIKRTLSQRYEENLINYLSNSPLNNVENARTILEEAGIIGAELESALHLIEEGNARKAFQDLIEAHGTEFISKLNLEEVNKKETQEQIQEEQVKEDAIDPLLNKRNNKVLVRRNPYSNGFGYILTLVAIVSFGIGAISVIVYSIISSIFK